MLKAAEPTYRPLEVDEIPIARDMRAAMVRELNRTDPDADYPGWRERYAAFYAPQLREDTAALFVAEIAGRPVGVAAVYLAQNHRTQIFSKPSAYVSNVWVEPDHRRKGIASALTRMTMAWAQGKGCEVVRLRSSDMGRPVYAAIGFVPTDEMELRFDAPEHRTSRR